MSKTGDVNEVIQKLLNEKTVDKKDESKVRELLENLWKKGKKAGQKER